MIFTTSYVQVCAPGDREGVPGQEPAGLLPGHPLDNNANDNDHIDNNITTTTTTTNNNKHINDTDDGNNNTY